MARIFDVIEYPSEMPDEIVHHFPETGVADIRWGSQLIVRESQNAIFMRDGKALDVFGLPHCAKRFPEDINRSARPCLNYYIKLCAGLCKGARTKEEHNEAVDAAVQFVLGGRQEYLRKMNAEMDAAAEALEFEKAAVLRDRIRAVEKVSQKQKVVSAGEKNQDVFGVVSLSDKTAVLKPAGVPSAKIKNAFAILPPKEKRRPLPLKTVSLQSKRAPLL